jgi:predicted ATPase
MPPSRRHIREASIGPASGPYLLKAELRRERVPSFDHFPFAVPAIREMGTLNLHPAVTFFVGENGTGKSTLLEALAISCGFNAEGGHAKPSLRDEVRSAST